MIPSFSSTHTPSRPISARSRLRQVASLLLGGLFAGLAGMMVSCGGGSSSSGDNPPPPPPAQVVIYGTVKNYQSNRGIPGAQVTDGVATTTTGATGSYSLLVSVTPGERKLITVKADGFGETQKVASNLTAENNYVNAFLLPSTIISVPDLDSETTLEVPGTSAQVVLPENALMTESGAYPVFPVKASLTPIDPTYQPELMPGDYSTNTGRSLESFGALDVTFTDNAGSKLNLAAGKTATIRIPAAALYGSGNGPALVPAWYYDTSIGRWVEEGALTLGGTAPNPYYEGTVSHFTTWNADDTTATAYITGYVVRKNGTIVEGATVKVTGSDYVGFSSVVTDKNGYFKIPVKASGISIVTASAYGAYGVQLFSPAPGLTVTAGTIGSETLLPTTTPRANSIVVDMYLNLTGTLRDFSPSAPYNLPTALNFTYPAITLKNGTFGSDTDWAKGTGWTITGGVATKTSGTASSLTQTLDSTQLASLNGKQGYPVKYTVTRTSRRGSVAVKLGTGPSGPTRGPGTYTDIVYCAPGDTTFPLSFNASSDFAGTIDDVTIGDGHPPAVTMDSGTPFPIYANDPILKKFDGPWWNPDFESSINGPGSETGLVEVGLGTDNKPVFKPDKAWSLDARSGIHSAETFNAWWTDFPSPHGPNDKDPYQIEYTIPLSEKVTPAPDYPTIPPTYIYENRTQFPIDQRLQGNYVCNNPGDATGARGTTRTAPEDELPHNFHYTYELHTMFVYKPGQFFRFVGDDDVWLFIDKKLVIDLGGIHSEMDESITLNADSVDKAGNKLNLVEGEYYQFDFFYAERHTTQSHMTITTSMAFVQPPN